MIRRPPGPLAIVLAASAFGQPSWETICASSVDPETSATVPIAADYENDKAA